MTHYVASKLLNDVVRWNSGYQRIDYHFPTTRLPCEQCHENYMDYLGHAIFEGKITTKWYVLCRDCIAAGIKEIVHEFSAYLQYYGLRITFTQMWDEEENGLVPVTRKGEMFSI